MTTVTVGLGGEVGPALRRERLREGLAQTALAQAAGVGRQWLNAFEAGDKPSAPTDMVLRVVAALGVTLVLEGDGSSGQRRELGTDVEDTALPDDAFDLDALIDGFVLHDRL